jgi:hypothetical protein
MRSHLEDAERDLRAMMRARMQDFGGSQGRWLTKP